MYVVGAKILKIGSKGNQESGKNCFFDCTISEQSIIPEASLDPTGPILLIA